MEARFAELGGELDPAYTAQADSYTDQLLQNYGSLYAANGIGEDTIRNYEYNLAKQTALIDLIYGQEGETPLTDEELTDHLQNEMLYLRYATVPLYNTSTFAFADEDQTAEMRRLAQEGRGGPAPPTPLTRWWRTPCPASTPCWTPSSPPRTPPPSSAPAS